MKKTLILALSVAFLFSACDNEIEKSENKTTEIESNTIDAEEELLKWKNELIGNVLGTPCDFDDISSPDALNWQAYNPDFIDGFPSNEEDIHIIFYDFDSDGKDDLLLYFESVNCTGHNGDTPAFAKVIFANGEIASNVPGKIMNAIIKEYNSKKENDTSLKEITDNYLRENISIQFDSGINGTFKLYTEEDAHCCPTYTGKYKFNVNNNSVDLTLN